MPSVTIDRGGAGSAGTSCRVVAHSNIALAKYWGKRDVERNLPDVPSLSLTLAALSTTTSVRFDPTLGEDEVVLGGAPADGATRAKVTALLDRVRTEAHIASRASVASHNDFPTASGLASSASGFAALALAALGAAGLSWSSAAVSALARASSVSAARSVFGGFVKLEAGATHAEPLDADASALRMVIAITASGPKAVGSTQGMLHTQRSSPYYDAWRTAAPHIYADLQGALRRGDLEQLGAAMEHSTLCMHASMFAAAPGIIYLNPSTLAAIDGVRALRARGTFAFFTMDAGPHVKVLTLAEHAAEVRRELESVPGVLKVMVSSAGEGARVVEHA